MPDNQPPESDPFADLYGRLPDPRTGARPGRSSDDGATESSAPLSRRAAREARRAETGPTGTTSDAAAEPAIRFDAARRAPGEQPAATATTPNDPPADDIPARRFAAAPAERPADGDAPGDDGIPADAPRTADAPAPAPAPRAAAVSADGIVPPRDPAPRGNDTAAPGRPGPRRTGAGPDAARTAPGSPSDDAPRSAGSARRTGPAAAAEPSRDREPALVGAGATAAAASSTPRAAASGSLEDLFTGQTTTHEMGQTVTAPPRRRRRVGGWIALFVVLLLVGGIAGGGFALWNTYGDRIQAFLGNGEPLDYEAGQATGEARVTIVSGDTGASVSPKLFEAGITKASNSLYKYMVDNSVVFTFQPGVYKLQQQMTSEAVLTALRNPENRLNYTVQLREGLTLKQSLDVISEQIGIPRADLDAATADPSQYGVPASTLEGWIFPATYDFDEGVTAQQVIERMVQRTVQSLDTAGVPEADRERILIIASIIEREARSSEDFYKVSRVIENRLQPDNDETHGLLQMDSTAQYGAGELDAGSSSSSENALTSDNPWNTYIRPGLPIGPIANPGDLAIDAAMKPVDGTWYYFTTVNLATGETVFSTTYADQLKAVEQFQAWCRENPDGGC
ncbi:endolytic transglycosylase MltG [Microbacterium testaceum]|uniref:Endolytic murein transglycosylase n=1 Tax=Microbacterium testaceum TaxID=2033 RepID=A0A2T7WFA9_MICTE|nr:endolytic transglycosylase MltG [Microbacterium testaceum]PVE69258.1 endolytic transglycosylase MltG [Microbacterium testaceum]